MRAGEPFRPFAAVPPRPRSPPGFSQLIDRLSIAVSMCAGSSKRSPGRPRRDDSKGGTADAQPRAIGRDRRRRGVHAGNGIRLRR